MTNPAVSNESREAPTATPTKLDPITRSIARASHAQARPLLAKLSGMLRRSR